MCVCVMCRKGLGWVERCGAGDESLDDGAPHTTPPPTTHAQKHSPLVRAHGVEVAEDDDLPPLPVRGPLEVLLWLYREMMVPGIRQQPEAPPRSSTSRKETHPKHQSTEDRLD